MTLAAAALRWPTLAGASFWVDEWVTRTIIQLPLLDMLRSVKATESTPPLYYVLAWAWAHLFGSGEFALRSLSGLFGAATVPVAYAAGAALASRRAGLVAACFVAVNPLLVWYSTEARAYSLLVLLGAMTLLFFSRAIVRPGGRELVLWSVTGSLALATHYFAAFLLAAEALVLLWVQGPRRRKIVFALVPMMVTSLALLPLVYAQAGRADWIPGLPFGSRLEEIPRNLAVGVSGPTGWREAAVALLVVAMLLMLTRADRGERRTVAIAFAVAMLAFILPLLAAALRSDYVIGRNLIAVSLPLMLAGAIVCTSRRERNAGLVVAIGLCAVWLSAVLAVASDSRFQRGDWKRAAFLLGHVPRDRLVLAWGEWGASPLGDHLGGARRLAPGESVIVAEIDMVGFDRPTGHISCWSGAACNMADVRLSPAVAPAGFSYVGGREGARFQVLRFRAGEPVPVRWLEVTRVDPRYGPPAVWLQLGRARVSQGRNESAFVP